MHYAKKRIACVLFAVQITEKYQETKNNNRRLYHGSVENN